MPLFVMTAVVAGLTLNSSATNLTTAVNGASSGTLSLRTLIMGAILRAERKLRVRGIRYFEGHFLHDLLGLRLCLLLRARFHDFNKYINKVYSVVFGQKGAHRGSRHVVVSVGPSTWQERPTSARVFPQTFKSRGLRRQA
jgi:hypothetical protein